MVKHVEIDSPIKKLLSNKARAHLKQYGGHPEQFADIFFTASGSAPPTTRLKWTKASCLRMIAVTSI